MSVVNFNQYNKKNTVECQDLLPFRQSTPPAPPDPAVYYGLAGEVVKTISPYSEADDVALLINFLAGFGNLVGRSAYFVAGADRHYSNLFVTLVGDTAKGRKGMSWNWIYQILKAIDEKWAEERCISGLSSGEGLICAAMNEKGEGDRLMVIEPEFASVMKVMSRQGNTLSPIIRNAWDGKILQIVTKNSPTRVKNAHISIIAHITKEELIKALNDTEKASGFANRFIWVYVKRSKYLPESEPVPQGALNALISKVHYAKEFAVNNAVVEIKRDDSAKKIWENIYPVLSAEQPGLMGAVLARAEAQVMRLAMLYALLDCSTLIRAEHLHAALALWDFCQQSARYIFADAGNVIEAEILNALQQGPLSQTQIYRLFSGNVPATEYKTALANLHRQGLIEYETITAPGAKKPTIIWKILNT